MNIRQALGAIHESLETSSPEELSHACKLIDRAEQITTGERDVVICAFKDGPIHDGQVPSKAGRDMLLIDGLISKVVVKGQDGYNALTHKGLRIYRILQALGAVEAT